LAEASPKRPLGKRTATDVSKPIMMKCPGCHEEMEEPKLLHSGHSLCDSCPRKMWKRSEARPRKKHIVCPVPKCMLPTELWEEGKLATNSRMRG